MTLIIHTIKPFKPFNHHHSRFLTSTLQRTKPNPTHHKDSDSDIKNSNPTLSESPVDSSDSQQPTPLPNSIRDAWKAGLKGYHPNQYSRLRDKSMTPIKNHSIPTITEQNQNQINLSSSDHPSISVPSTSSKPKPSLLQTYLSLDKRSQRFVSISIFIWAFSGFAYFTWFSEPPPIDRGTRKL